MGTHRLLEHTADMGIEVEAESLEDLFAEAALGLREVIFDGSRGWALDTYTLEARGEDEGEMLVDFLAEVLFLVESRGLFPATIASLVIEGSSVRAGIGAEPFDSERHVVEREVKAVTFHQLRVERLGGLWRAQVYLDL